MIAGLDESINMLNEILAGECFTLTDYALKQACVKRLNPQSTLGFVRKLLALDHTALKISSCASPIKILIYTCKLVRELGPLFR
ncbi:MAG TPA: hypothetical protein DIW40_12240 [Halomonas sp.]|nr:hypothetical protein [Halomonas sp.]